MSGIKEYLKRSGVKTTHRTCQKDGLNSYKKPLPPASGKGDFCTIISQMVSLEISNSEYTRGLF